MNTQAKIAAALLLVLATAVTTTATLGYFIYERTLSGLATSRFDFIAKELKRKVETGLDLGLPLGELENINELLRQQLLTDDALAGLTIQNAKGMVLFDTDPARIGTRPDAPWLDGLVSGDDKATEVSIEGLAIGVPLVNSFGRIVGGLTVAFSKAHYDEKRATTIRDLAHITLITLLTCSLAGLCGVLTISRPLEHAVVRLEASLQSILMRLGSDTHQATQPEALDHEIFAFEQNVLQAVIALERASGGAALSDRPEPVGEDR